jgi:hypothetical protein
LFVCLFYFYFYKFVVFLLSMEAVRIFFIQFFNWSLSCSQLACYYSFAVLLSHLLMIMLSVHWGFGQFLGVVEQQ